MALQIQRWLETKRAPKKSDNFGRRYTPSGIDIYTTADPELVKLSEHDRYSVRVADLLTILDELDRYEGRRKLDGEDIKLKLDMVKPESKRGDIYHEPGFLLAQPDEKQRGLVCLTVFHGFGGAITLTADRGSLREALNNRHALADLEREDQDRLGQT